MAFRGTTTPSYGAIPQVSYEGRGFNPSEFSHLYDSGSSEIATISTNVGRLQGTLRQLGTANDSPSLRDGIHDLQQKLNSCIKQTAQVLKALSAVSKTGPKQNKLQAEKLCSDFHVVVNKYSLIQKQIADKVRVSFRRPTSTTIGWADAAQEEPTDDDHASLLEQQAEQKQKQMQINSELEFEHALILEREERILQIQSDIIDVNQIFRDLGVLVHEQGDSINTIEANVERVTVNVEDGRSELQKAVLHQRGYRKKLCVLVLILLVIAIIILVIIVSNLR